jgi:hypothetical protein
VSRHARTIRIYIEGGGNSGELRDECRRGFAKFFAAEFKAVCPKLIACGSRMNAYDKFRKGLVQHKNDALILLVDAEAPVTKRPWAHVAARKGDNWQKPAAAIDDQLHFMVQCMESWFLADGDALAAYFGQGFNPKALPKNAAIEKIAKEDVLRGLESATRQSKTKGAYSKGRHSFALLGRIDPAKVQARSTHAKRLFDALNQLGMR